jgi:CP family cyanate transporter-like MFS transporter
MVPALLLLWLCGGALRITILAVPPVVPLLHADLQLGQTGISVLSALPTLMFAWAAIPGAFLIARLGAVQTLTAGLVVTAAASAMRGAAQGTWLLFASTLVMGMGVAIMQPSLPPLVRAWLPDRVGLGTAVYTNGILVAQVLVVGLTIPYLLPFLYGSWRLSLVVWSIPVALAALVAVALRGRLPRPATLPKATGFTEVRNWWPEWGNPKLWRLGLFMGSINSTFFATNAFLPDYVTHLGRPDLVGPALTGLNIAALPASVLMLFFAGRLVHARWAPTAFGLLTLLGVGGMLASSGWGVVVSAAIIGFANAAGLVLAFALPAILGAQKDIPRLSAGMFTIGYHCAVLVMLFGGIGWDITGSPLAAAAPIALAGLVMALGPPRSMGDRGAPAG